jgi:hypothetical protein
MSTTTATPMIGTYNADPVHEPGLLDPLPGGFRISRDADRGRREAG